VNHPTSSSATAQLSAEVVRLMRASHAMKAQIHAADPHRLEWASSMLLFQLCKDGPQRSSSLAATACVDPSTVSRQIASLVDLGLVERRADPHDGRATLLAATEAGEARFHQVHDRRDRAFATVLADWADDDLQTLTGLLHRLNNTLMERRGTLIDVITARPVLDHPQTTLPLHDVLETS
jgi:DNA-binding MarR family transcriptional regulator